MSEPGKSEPAAEPLESAALHEWKFWIVAVLALVAAGYFYTTESLVPEMRAEIFYAIIALVIAVVAAAAGVVNVRKRMRKYDF